MAKLCPLKSPVKGHFQVTAALSCVTGFGRAVAHWNIFFSCDEYCVMEIFLNVVGQAGGGQSKPLQCTVTV